METQIIALYEHPTNPMSIREISEATGIDEFAIKIALAKGSEKYKKQQIMGDGEFTKSDDEMAMMVIRQLAIASESPSVRFRAAVKMFDERRGRNNAKGLKTLNVSVNTFNQIIQDVQKAKERTIVVDIDENHKHLKEMV